MAKSKRRTFDALKPPDWEHYEKYPLTTSMAEALSPTPVVWGINWYSGFDSPERASDGRWWLPGPNAVGHVRGRHAIASPAGGLRDSEAWQLFYDQGTEGACVGFSCSRLATWFNRRRYDARWLYHEAQKVDEWPGEDYEGSSVRAGLNVLKERGHREVRRSKSLPEDPGAGIAAYRWANDVQDVIEAQAQPYGKKVGAVPLCNSWGDDYPRVVWLPGETAHLLLEEDGEAGVPTDK